MNLDWFKVFIAALFEVLWVIGLKHADSILEWLGTVLAIVISFYGLIASGRRLPVGTVYAVFVGLGTAGTTAVDILVFGEPFKFEKIIFIALLLAGVIGLKMVTDKTDAKEGAESNGVD